MLHPTTSTTTYVPDNVHVVSDDLTTNVLADDLLNVHVVSDDLTTNVLADDLLNVHVVSDEDDSTLLL